LGSSYNIQHQIELCKSADREVVGLIDPDYDTQKDFKGIPVLDRNTYFDKKNQFEFFVVTWWQPFQDIVHIRSKQKRLIFLDWMQQFKLTGATLIHDTAVVSPYALIGRNVSVGALSILVNGCQIHDHVNVREQCYISHNVKIDSNSMIQIKATVTGDIKIGHDTYIGIASTLVNSRPLDPMQIGNHVIIHPNQLVVESVADNTIVSYKKPPFVV